LVDVLGPEEIFQTMLSKVEDGHAGREVIAHQLDGHG
jgi:hypothetical protein